MNQDIERLAKEAGLDIVEMIAGTPSFVAQADIRDFEMFIHLLAEECAKAVEQLDEGVTHDVWTGPKPTCSEIIRQKFPMPKGEA